MVRWDELASLAAARRRTPTPVPVDVAVVARVIGLAVGDAPPGGVVVDQLRDGVMRVHAFCVIRWATAGSVALSAVADDHRLFQRYGRSRSG